MTAPPPEAATPARSARTVFLGSGAFAVPILEALVRHPAVELVGVVTPPDRPAGRHGRTAAVPVATEARRRALHLVQPERFRAPETAAAIATLAPELGVLADFGRIVPASILELPGHGILNVHPSLLPRHRGAAPIPATILAGDPTAGVTVFRMDEGLDTGPVVATRAWPLEATATTPELEARAAREGAALLEALLGPYLLGARPAVPQDESAATTTKPLRRSDGLLDPALPAGQLERRVRALQPWPGTFVESPVGRLAILAAAVAPSAPGDEPGSLVTDADGLALTTAEGRLRLLRVQGAGGRPMPGPDFRRGHPAVLGPVARDPG